jgi:hypothetical protein
VSRLQTPEDFRRSEARAVRRSRWEAVFAMLVPWGLVAAIIVGLALLLAGCAARQAAGYTTRDEVRASCASAAHAYTLAVERTRAGAMSAESFATISAGYDGVVATCRRVLLADARPVPADAARVDAWTARTEAETR